MRDILINKNKIFDWILAFLFVAGTFGFYRMEDAYVNVMYFLSAWALQGLISRTREIHDRKVKWSSFFFAVFLTASFAIGRQISGSVRPYFPDLTLLDWAYLLPFGGLVYTCVLNMMDWILKHGITFSESDQKVNYGYWAKVFLFIVICWTPYFLVFYPGAISWDSLDSVEQVVGTMPWSNWHPVVYTASIGLFMKLGMLIGDINFGIACYSAAQLLAFAGILSYCVYWMKKNGAPDWMLLLTAGYFALDPVIATYSITMWKDVLFSGFLLLFVLFIADVAKSRGEILADRNGLIRLVFIYLLVAFWRNNGIYILAGMTLVLGIVYRKHWKKIVPICLAVLCLIVFIQGPVYEKLGIESVNFAESAGILLQQIAYTLEQNGPVDPESLSFLEQIMPLERWLSQYQPFSADSLKFDDSFQNAFFNENSGTFLKTWLELLPGNFESYVKAQLMNTLGYFHIGTDAEAVWYGIIPLPQAEALQIVRTDLLQQVMKTDIVASVIEAFLYFMYKLPVFSIIYSIAASVWTVFLCAVILLHQKKVEELLPLLPLVALWGTLMIAAPVHCEFRYLFAFHLALPVVLMFMFRKAQERDFTV